MRLLHHLPRLALLMALTVALAPGGAGAAVIAYEGFGYGAGADLSGQNGGTGWAGAWNNQGGAPTLTTAPGLGFGALAVTPGAASTAVVVTNDPGAKITTYTRSLATAFGTDGTTTYLSFLLRPDSGFDFYGGLNLGGGLFIGKSGTPVTTYGLETGGANIASSSVVATAGEAVFLVLRAQFLAGNDVLDLFVNPTLGGAEPLLADAEMSNVDLALTDLLYINNSGGWTIDEIRVGSSFADVAPVQVSSVPEPAMLALVLLALSAMAFTRLSGKVRQRLPTKVDRCKWQ